MNISQTAVTNAVNLAFFMVNLSRRLLRDFRRNHHSEFSILDLKACYRAVKYVDEVMKLLPQKPEPILISRIKNQVANLGANKQSYAVNKGFKSHYYIEGFYSSYFSL